MDHLEQLERLNRLRESGGLTQEEYDAQKAKLLNPEFAPATESTSKPTRNTWLVVAGIAAVSIIALVLFFTLHNPPIPNGPETATANTSDSFGNTIAPEPTPTPIATPTLYAWATDVSLVGSNPGYLEQKLGAAREKSQTSLTFMVEGCRVEYVTKGTQVQSIRMYVEKSCHPVVDGMTITPKTTFASLEGKGGSVQSYCIGGLCGNVADPTIDLFYGGSHANNFVGYYFVGAYDDKMSGAMDVWLDDIAKANGVANSFNLDYKLVNCLKDAPKDVVREIRPVHIALVEVGWNVDQGCTL